jgi:hypothetical protein
MSTGVSPSRSAAWPSSTSATPCVSAVSPAWVDGYGASAKESWATKAAAGTADCSQRCASEVWFSCAAHVERCTSEGQRRPHQRAPAPTTHLRQRLLQRRHVDAQVVDGHVRVRRAARRGAREEGGGVDVRDGRVAERGRDALDRARDAAAATLLRVARGAAGARGLLERRGLGDGLFVRVALGLARTLGLLVALRLARLGLALGRVVLLWTQKHTGEKGLETDREGRGQRRTCAGPSSSDSASASRFPAALARMTRSRSAPTSASIGADSISERGGGTGAGSWKPDETRTSAEGESSW